MSVDQANPSQKVGQLILLLILSLVFIIGMSCVVLWKTSGDQALALQAFLINLRDWSLLVFFAIAIAPAAMLGLSELRSIASKVVFACTCLLTIGAFLWTNIAIVYTYHGAEGESLAVVSIGVSFALLTLPPVIIGASQHRKATILPLLIALIVYPYTFPAIATFGNEYRERNQANAIAEKDIEIGNASNWACSSEGGIWDPDAPTHCNQWRLRTEHPHVCIGDLDGQISGAGKCREWTDTDSWPPLAY